jgi:uncharacterized protein YdcH (DUF465 family)
MIDPISKLVEQVPENKDVIRLLQETNSQFGTLCKAYGTLNDKLDALDRIKGSNALARASALRQQLMTIEEELLTMIEGYRPV